MMRRNALPITLGDDYLDEDEHAKPAESHLFLAVLSSQLPGQSRIAAGNVSEIMP